MLLEYESITRSASSAADFTFVLGSAFCVKPDGTYVLDRKEDSFLDVIDALDSMTGKLDSKAAKRVRLDVSGLTDTVRRTLVGRLAKMVFRTEEYISDPREVQRRRKTEKVFVAVDKIGKRAFWEDMIARTRSGDLARNLSSAPSNLAFPAKFCEIVTREFQRFEADRYKIEVLDEHDIARMHMGGLQHVGKASVNPPRILVIETDLNPSASSATPSTTSTCLVGKGITFDTGGINLSSPRDMRMMHMDKMGGSVVVGIVHYLLSLPRAYFTRGERVVALVALAENMPGGNALKPRDIITSYNGKTIEVDNTDAEGRLVLADVFHYACEKYRPGNLLDFATLTGWSDQLFCDSSFSFFANDDRLARVVEEAGVRAGERSVRMPKYTGYARYSASTVADLKNDGYTCSGFGSSAGAGYMAAMFLSHFVPKRLLPHWIHLDIANLQTQKNGAMLNNANSVDTGFELMHHLLGVRRRMKRMTNART